MNINQVAMGCKPDPNKFSIKHIEHINNCTIVIANYGGTTFNGDKLIVLKGIHDSFITLDPHFLNEDYPVFARFQPTEEGLSLAKSICINVISNEYQDKNKQKPQIDSLVDLHIRRH